MMRAVGAFMLCQVAMASDVQFDWPLLTDFTTEFHFNDKYLAENKQLRQLLPKESRAQMPVEEEHGVIQFDLSTERLQIKVDGDVQVPDPRRDPTLASLGITSIHGHSEVRFNGPAGFASMRGKYTAGGFAFEFCVKANVLAGMIPPPAAIMPNLQEKEEQIQAQVNQIPHQDVDWNWNGEKVVQFTPAPKVYALLHHNGVPMGVDISDTQPSADMDHQPLMSFSNWHSGAGHIEEVDCHAETSAIELLATPGGIEVLEHLDRVVGAFGTLGSYTLAAQVLPLKPSLLVRQAAKEELAQIKTAPALSETMMAVVAGVSGALISTAVVMVMLRPSRNLRREPLISDDA